MSIESMMPFSHLIHTHWIIEKAREFQKNIYFCFLDYAKALDCVDHNKLWKILKEMGPCAQAHLNYTPSLLKTEVSLQLRFYK